MHPTLDDSRVSSTMRSFRPKYRKITPETRSLHNFTSHLWSFKGGKPFKYSALGNRLLRRWSSLFGIVLFVCLYFSHVPSLLPPNTVFIRFNVTSLLLFLCNGYEGLLIDNRFVMSLKQIFVSRLAAWIAAHTGSRGRWIATILLVAEQRIDCSSDKVQ